MPDGLALAGSGRRLERERLPLGNSLNRQLDDSLLRLSADLNRTDPPALTADRRKCTLCSWRGLCNDVASQEGHLSEVSGIGAKRREMLQEIGVNSLQALAAANPKDLDSGDSELVQTWDALGGGLSGDLLERQGYMLCFNSSPKRVEHRVTA